METTKELEKEKNLSVQDIKTGDFLGEIQRYRVLDVGSRASSVLPEVGTSITVDNSIIEKHMYSASHYNEERKVTRTQLIAIFQSIHEGVFQVEFLKKPKEKEIVDTMVEYLDNQEGIFLKALRDAMSRDYRDQSEMEDSLREFFDQWEDTSKEFKKDAKKEIKQAAKGEKRVLIGYKYYSDYDSDNFEENLLAGSINDGMSKVIDLEIPSDKYRIRQIRHDGLISVTYRNVKYVVK
jgi:hypothetical protein